MSGLTSGLLVNGEIAEDITSRTKILSLFGRLGITLGSSRLLFSPDRILIDSKMSVSWKKPCRITIDQFNLVIHDRQNVTVTHDDGMRMLIQLHTRIKHPSYFDLFLEDNDGFSSGASGIIGEQLFELCWLYHVLHLINEPWRGFLAIHLCQLTCRGMMVQYSARVLNWRPTGAKSGLP